MMKQSIQNRGCDDCIAEDRTPLAIALVGNKYDAASFVAGADELKENRRAQLIQRQIAHLINDQHLRSKIKFVLVGRAGLRDRRAQDW